MPRHPTTTTAELEHQIAADSQLGELDEAGLERLPTFDDPPQTHEQQIAELDARDDRLNGHAAEVRPSQRCKIKSPTGIGCTLHKTHDDRHSWEAEQDDSFEAHGYDYAAAPKFTDKEQAGQTSLPGTPEPEVDDDYAIPTEASFGKAKLMPAAGLKSIGDRLIADDDDLEHLRGIEIRYAWRRRGGMQGGNPRYARIKRPSVWEGYFTGGTVEFLVDVSADHVREFRFTEQQIEAALHEQLTRTARDEDDHDAFRINGPDFSGSLSTLDKYGAWRPELREANAHFRLLPMDEALNDAIADVDEGEDSE